MKLIAEKRASNDKYDRLRFVRNNGSCAEISMPRQGILPHDLLHYVVETALPFRFGFLSQVAHGAEAEFVMTKVHNRDDPSVELEAVQVEAAVEGLQSQLWAGSFDHAAFLSGAAMACTVRGKPPYDFDGIDLERSLYQRALALHERWTSLPYFSTLSLDFQPR